MSGLNRTGKMTLFQSTLPRRERRFLPFKHTYPIYFNPRSREGSDMILVIILQKFMISIHAPAKGATPLDEKLGLVPKISIHAPAKGATTLPEASWILRRNFNPRSREGSDSIRLGKLANKQIFQSTLPRRERHFLSARHWNLITFQSTLPRRERQDLVFFVCNIQAISIHAPAKGATGWSEESY